jgi:hypothetical protein
MALACHSCGAAMDAMTSVRCRQCRQLVCRECVSEKGGGEGVLCVPCARVAEDREESDEEAPAEAPGQWREEAEPASPWRENLAHRWPALVLVVLTAALFLTIAFWPRVRARTLRERLAGEDPELAEEAAEALVERGGRSVLEEMLDLLITGEEEIDRLRAIRVLGQLGYPQALPELKAVRDDPEESEHLRAAAREAVIRIREEAAAIRSGQQQ